MLSGPLPEAPNPGWRIEDPIAEQQYMRPIPGKIELQYMTQRSEVKDQEEDWTGKNSTALRRKLQNRLNQRASRRSSPSPSLLPSTPIYLYVYPTNTPKGNAENNSPPKPPKSSSKTPHVHKSNKM